MASKELSDAIDLLAATCRDSGWGLADALERGGLLLTPERALRLQEDVLATLLQRLDGEQHTALAQLGNGQTVSGAVRGCVAYIDMFRESLAKEPK